LRTKGIHHHDIPMLLQDALVETSYGEEVPDYRGRLYIEHGLPHCEVHVDIRSHPMFHDGCSWSTWIIGNDMDNTMEKAAHMGSPPCAHSAHLTLRARPSHSTRSRTALIQSGRPTWMRRATSFRTSTTLVGHTW
jgi:hypothetical protein